MVSPYIQLSEWKTIIMLGGMKTVILDIEQPLCHFLRFRKYIKGGVSQTSCCF
jgi:hypothetical protein